MKKILIKLTTAFKKTWGFMEIKINQDFWGFMNTLILLGSIYVIYEQLRIQSQSNVVQTLNSISDKWETEQMMQARNNICRNWLRINSDTSENMEIDSFSEFFSDRNAQKVTLYMEHIGLFYKIGAVTREDIWEIKSWEIENYYCIFQKYIEAERTMSNDKSFYTNFENLYKRMQAENKRRGTPFGPRTTKELKEFCLGEIDLKNSK